MSKGTHSRQQGVACRVGAYPTVQSARTASLCEPDQRRRLQAWPVGTCWLVVPTSAPRLLLHAAIMDPNLKGLTLAFCAGTGRMGSNLARLYALAGFRVIIGSRDPAKAQALAQQLRDQHPDSQLRVEGASNAEAAAAADVVHWCIMVRCKRSMPYAPMERE